MYNKRHYMPNVFIDARGNYRYVDPLDELITPLVPLHPATLDDWFCHRYCGVPYVRGDYDG